jgi:hypothetical protein
MGKPGRASPLRGQPERHPVRQFPLHQLPCPGCMHLVEIRLASFLYRFRRLTWREEAGIKPKPGQTPGDLLLALALHDISGLPISSREETTQVIQKIPPALRWRIWVVYRGNQPEDRYSVLRGCTRPRITPPTKRLIDEGLILSLQPEGVATVATCSEREKVPVMAANANAPPIASRFQPKAACNGSRNKLNV